MTRPLIVNTDRKLTRELRRLLCEIGARPRPEFVLLGTDSPAVCLAEARRLRTAVPDVPVIAVGRTADCDLLSELAQMGVTSFVAASCPPEIAGLWLRDAVATVQSGNGDTGRHCRHLHRPGAGS